MKPLKFFASTLLDCKKRPFLSIRIYTIGYLFHDKVTENCDGKIEIRRRLAIATNKLMCMKSRWKGESAQIKLKILRACIFTVSTYGCET